MGIRFQYPSGDPDVRNRRQMPESKEKEMNNRIAFCGLDCEKCDAYPATIHDDRALREKTAKLWSEWNQAEMCRKGIQCIITNHGAG